MTRLIEKYPQEVEHILSKYPPEEKRSAVMPLLYLAQREAGYISQGEIEEVAEVIGVSSTEVASLIGFYTLFHGRPEGKIRIQVCNDLPCALRGADEFLAGLCERLGVRAGETTPDGQVTLEAVMCLAACDKAPMFQVQTPTGLTYHENQTVESALAMIRNLKIDG